MTFTSSFFLLSGVAAVAVLALGETVKFSALENFERSFEGRLQKNQGKRPFEILSNASAVYVAGSGVVLTSRVNLVYIILDGPFSPSNPVEVAAQRQKLRQDKLEKVPVLEENMRESLADAANSPDFDAVRPTENFVIGVTLHYFPAKIEDSTGLPRQITMSAEKQKLIQARRDKVDLTTVIQEQKL